jgi:hypothetical protein
MVRRRSLVAPSLAPARQELAEIAQGAARVGVSVRSKVEETGPSADGTPRPDGHPSQGRPNPAARPQNGEKGGREKERLRSERLRVVTETLARRGPAEPGGAVAAASAANPRCEHHGATARLVSDFSFDPSWFSRREAASPQSPPLAAILVAPWSDSTFVVQWRRIVPPRGRAARGLAPAAQLGQSRIPSPPAIVPIELSQAGHVCLETRVIMVRTRISSPRPGGGATRLSCGWSVRRIGEEFQAITRRSSPSSLTALPSRLDGLRATRRRP